jgi:hypothetical protein
MKRLYFLLLSLAILIISGCAYRKVSSAPPDSFPKFALPPPTPSATDKLSKSYFKNCKTLHDVDSVLSYAMTNCGYVRRSYYYVPNGFAMVTQLEQINEDGTSKPDDVRWDTTNNIIYHHSSFSLLDYIYRLFHANPGFYRCMAFVITDTIYSYSPKVATKSLTSEWLSTGTNSLPYAYSKQQTINDSYDFNHCT